MDSEALTLAISHARQNLRTSRVSTDEEVERRARADREEAQKAELISQQTYNELLPGLNLIKGAVTGFMPFQPKRAFPLGALFVNFEFDHCSSDMLFGDKKAGWRSASIHITGRRVKVREKIMRKSLVVTDPSAAYLEVDLDKDPAGVDKILQHVAVMAVEGPRHPGFRRPLRESLPARVA